MIFSKYVALIIMVLLCKLKIIMCTKQYGLLDHLGPATGYMYHIENNGPPQIVYYLTSTDLDRIYSPRNLLDVEKQVRSLPLLQKKSDKSERTVEKNVANSESEKNGSDSVEISEEQAQSYGDKYKKNSGKKTKKEYSSDFSYSKGKKSSYDKKYDSGDEKSEKSNHATKHDETSNESEHNSEEEEKKSGEFGSKKSHQKGAKSKGYHNIFMKDEYKKDHIFYDKDDHEGHYKKSGSSNKKYHKNGGERAQNFHREEKENSKNSDHHGSDHKKASEEKDEGYVKKSGSSSIKNDHEKHSNQNGKQSYHVAIRH